MNAAAVRREDLGQKSWPVHAERLTIASDYAASVKAKVQVVTADSVQGGEYEVRLVSLVSTERSWCFVGEKERANVLGTRAREVVDRRSETEYKWFDKMQPRLSSAMRCTSDNEAEVDSPLGHEKSNQVMLFEAKSVSYNYTRIAKNSSIIRNLSIDLHFGFCCTVVVDITLTRT